MLETPGVRQTALLSVQQSFAVSLIHTTVVHVHRSYSNTTVFPDQRLTSLTYLGCAQPSDLVGDLQEKLNCGSSQVKDSSITALQLFQPPSPTEQVSDLLCISLLSG